MSKRKTRHEKLKTQERKSAVISYSFSSSEKTPDVSVREIKHSQLELKKILVSTSVLLFLNLALFFLLTTGFVRLGFLGY